MFFGEIYRVRKRTVDQDECNDELSSKQPRVIFEESNYDVYENESETHEDSQDCDTVADSEVIINECRDEPTTSTSLSTDSCY